MTDNSEVVLQTGEFPTLTAEADLLLQKQEYSEAIKIFTKVSFD
jgi:hypothetical protein